MSTQRLEDGAAEQPAAAAALSESGAAPELPAEYWVERLASRRATERAEAEERVGRGDPQTIEALIATLERENRKKKRRFAIGTAAGMAVIIAIQVLIGALLTEHLNVAGSGWIAGVAVGAAVAPTRLQKAVARVLAAQDELRAVGPLCEALDRQDDATKRLAASALSRLLPRMRASDADLLSPGARGILWKALAKTPDARLARGILNAAVQTGDEKALPSVERIVRGKGAGRRDMALRSEASDAIPALRQRASEERVRMTLLRPSEAPDASSQTLLRPALGAATVNPDLLLRPAEGGTEPS